MARPYNPEHRGVKALYLFQDSFLDIGWPLMSHLFLEKSADGSRGDGADDDAAKGDADLEDYDYDHEKDDHDSHE